MIGYSALNNVFNQLFDTLLVKKIYHDVFIIINKENKVPAYRSGNDWMPIGLDDRKSLYCYIRQNGDATNSRTDYLASSQKQYNLRVPYRLVFFNANEIRDFDFLTTTILNISFGQYVDLTRLITDVQQLQNIEGNITDFVLTGKAFYVALDISILIKITKDNCEAEVVCDKLPNPICKT